uniref:Uncharacterized protein n=1 Tax=uncultured bacterium Contig1795 TaxID=1393518 RepID=W0FQM0_9BACT|nr:hypothetical protein [uncultured bacterium Contig1795]
MFLLIFQIPPFYMPDVLHEPMCFPALSGMSLLLPGRIKR